MNEYQARVTRWVTTGCGLKPAQGVAISLAQKSHPVGHHRVWIETARCLPRFLRPARHPVGHHRVWIETSVHFFLRQCRRVTRWVTTGCGLKQLDSGLAGPERRVTRWVTTGCGLKPPTQHYGQGLPPCHPVGHHRVWIETPVALILGYLTQVTRWVTTGCGLKQRPV